MAADDILCQMLQFSCIIINFERKKNWVTRVLSRYDQCCQTWGFLPILGIFEPFGEVFGDSDLVGIGLGKSEILGDKHGGFSYKMPCWNFFTLFINYDNYNEKKR